MPNAYDIFFTVQEMVRNCERCDLRQTCTQPVPISGRPYAPILVIGEAPGAEEDKEGIPFVGGAGKLLRWSLREAGIRISDVNFTNTIRCRPPKNRIPYESERTACDVNFRMEINASKSTVLLLAGGVALSQFRDDLKIKEDHSRPLIWEDKILVPTYHPASAIRSPKHKDILIEDLRQARYWVHNKASVTHPNWPTTCRICEQDADRFDDWGVMYCDYHYKPFVKVDQGVLF